MIVTDNSQTELLAILLTFSGLCVLAFTTSIIYVSTNQQRPCQISNHRLLTAFYE